MHIITCDLETFWAQGYTLTTLPPLEYVMDERFEIICCGFKVDSEPTQVVFGQAGVQAWFDSHRALLADSIVIGHNLSGFDAYVLAYRLGVRPKLWGDTLAMARPLHAKAPGLSLAKLVEHYGLGVKDKTALINTRGKRLAEFTPDERAAMAMYNAHDVDQCRGLFDILKPHYSVAELWQIDAMVRMRTEPQFGLDRGALTAALATEQARQEAVLDKLAWVLGTDRAHIKDELASSARFTKLLEVLCVEVPTKPSPTDPEKRIPALAKSDAAFIAMLEHPDERVAAAVGARLDVKSTILESRIQRFLAMGKAARGWMPVPLNYCGADTTGRDSGAESLNAQNLPKVSPKEPKPSDVLRASLIAPKGKVVIVADLSGIELRVNHFLWQEPASMALYRADPAHADLYKSFAASLYDKPVEEIDKHERQVGKVSQLGLGYGSGHVTFQHVARMLGGVKLEPNESKRVVDKWRGTYRNIVLGWSRCDSALGAIHAGKSFAVDPWGLVGTCKEGFTLPSGRLIRYPNLRWEEDGTWPDGRVKQGFIYADGRYRTGLWGSKCDENCVQALARDVVFDDALEFFKRTGLRPAHRVHDELIYVVDEHHAQELLDELQAVMRTPPKWWPELVVWSEGGMGKTYAEAK